MEEFNSNSEPFWTKDKLKELITRYASESRPSASGDQPRRACRLCAGDKGLRAFSDPRGERYDSLVLRCFGIVVTTSDSMICERCVRQLHSTERFRALVESAFESKTLSDSGSPNSSITCVPKTEPQTLTIKPPIITESVSREIIKKPKKIFGEKKIPNPTPVAKKNNIACSMCKQRYPVLVPSTGRSSSFVCARCNSRRTSLLRKCNVPCAVALNQLCTTDSGRHRTVTGSKSQKKCDSVLNYHGEPRRYDCSQCKQRFILPHRLAEHINNVHRDSLDTTCVVCGEDLKTPTKLGNHLKIHTGELHQCEMCMVVFKSKHALKTHMIAHKRARIA